jgi:hypothetical protein
MTLLIIFSPGRGRITLRGDPKGDFNHRMASLSQRGGLPLEGTGIDEPLVDCAIDDRSGPDWQIEEGRIGQYSFHPLDPQRLKRA